MPYIGNDIRANEDYKIIDDISSGFNGSATSFALQVGGSAPVPFPKFEQQLLISVNGVIQEPDPSGSAGFRLSGTNIVFSSAPTNGHAFFGVIYAGADYLNAGGTFPSGTASVPSITFSSDTDTGIFSPSSGTVAITSNGTKVAQFPTGTGSSGQTLITDGAGVLSFANPTGTTASSITVADESSDTTCFPIFTTGATGNLAPKSGSNLAFNSSSGLLTATGFSGSGASLTSLNASNISSGTISASRVPTLNQNTTGSAATLTTARTIGGVSFDGSANINLPGVNTSGNQNTSGTAAIATTISVGDESSDTTCFPVFTTAASGNLAPKTGSNITFNSSSGLLTATNFSATGLTLSSTSADCLNFSGNGADSRGISFNNRTALSADASDGFLRINNDNEFSNGVYTPGVMRADGGFKVGGTTVISSSGAIIAAQVPTLNQNTTGSAGTLDGIDSSQFLRSDTADSATGELSLDKIVCTGQVSVDSTTHGGGTVTFDFDTSCHHLVNMTANSTFAQPNNQNSGQTGSIFLVQDGTGSRTGSFNSAFKFVGGTAPTLSTAANAVDRIDYVIKANNEIHCAVSLDVK